MITVEFDQTFIGRDDNFTSVIKSEHGYIAIFKPFIFNEYFPEIVIYIIESQIWLIGDFLSIFSVNYAVMDLAVNIIRNLKFSELSACILIICVQNCPV